MIKLFSLIRLIANRILRPNHNLNFAQDKTDKLKRNVNIRIEAEASTLTLTELIRVLLAYLDNLVTFPRSSRQAPTRII